jgi:hypothetical protein
VTSAILTISCRQVSSHAFSVRNEKLYRS